ncbi:MAG: hypothetical protein B7Y90_11965 [Alphaproteobacteria bacterium 32-64-14]|nr:MAG: hypothetical protein B7Y90_11965 [Alphaproteobacteria bacterium 32-64-14]
MEINPLAVLDYAGIGADVFWVKDAGYVIVCTVVAVLVFLTRGRGVHQQTLLWLDAVGLCVYACVGAAKSLSLGVDPVICVVMGALTATFGGIIRDVLAGVPSILLSRELYITPAIVSAAVFIVLRTVGMDWTVATGIAVALGFFIRAGAIRWKWAMPAFAPPKGK